MPELRGLTIRQHERQDIRLVIEFLVAEEYRRQVRFSANSAAPGQALVRGAAIDLSTGGMGLLLDQFVPRMCEGTVRVFSPTPVSTGHDGAPIYDVIFEHRVKVRRAKMASHDPTYAVGVSFIDPEPDLGARIDEMTMMAIAASASAASAAAAALEGDPDGDA